VQFLPDSGLLLPPRAGDHRVRWHSPNRSHKNASPTFELLASATQAPVNPTTAWGLGLDPWPPDPDQARTRFVRRFLLTEVVRDARGQLGQERYLGLYEPGDTGTTLTCVHRSPALAPFEREETLERVRLRVVEFQEDVGRAGKTVSRFHDPTQPAVWDEAVGPADPAVAQDRSADAPTRVIRVSPPVTLPAEPAGRPAAVAGLVSTITNP
jgi:hypothetical protein